jgi:hypothetical protein
VEIEKQLKVINIKYKENEDNFNKKINIVNDALKNKLDKDTFYTFSEEVDIIKKKLEEFKQEYHNTVILNILENFNWMKKKVESMTLTVSELKSTKNNGKDKDIDFYLSDVVGSGKYLEISVFNEYKASMTKEVSGISNKVDEIKRLVEDLQLLLNTKANEKDLKWLEGNIY